MSRSGKVKMGNLLVCCSSFCKDKIVCIQIRRIDD